MVPSAEEVPKDLTILWSGGHLFFKVNFSDQLFLFHGGLSWISGYLFQVVCTWYMCALLWTVACLRLSASGTRLRRENTRCFL